MLLAMLMALGCLAGCSGNQQGDSSKPASTPDSANSSSPVSSDSASEVKDLIIAVSAEPSNLDPQGIGMSTGLTMSGVFIYDSLLHYNSATGEVEPSIITEWNWLDDTTLNVKIRDDVVSVSGSKITTADVQWMMERATTLAALSAYAGSFDASGIEILGDYEMNLKLKTPDPIALNYLCLTNFGVQSKSDWEAAGGTDGVSQTAKAATGQYILKEWVVGDHMELVRNDNYWGEKAPYETVTIRYISDASSRQMALQSGDVMAIDRVPQSQASTISGDANLSLIEMADAWNTYQIPLDCTHPALSNVKVRQAMNMAINRQALLASVFFGFGTVSDGPFHSGHTLYSAPSADEEWVFDLEAAQQLMAEAGYADGFDMTMIVMSTNQTYMDVCEFAQAAWSKLNINVNIETYDNATFFTKLNGGEWDAYSIASSGINYLSPIKFTDNRRQVSAQGYTQFNPTDETEFHKITDLMYTTLDTAAAKECAADYQRVVRQEVPVLNLVNSSILFATSSSVSGAALSPMGDPDFSGLTSVK